MTKKGATEGVDVSCEWDIKWVTTLREGVGGKPVQYSDSLLMLNMSQGGSLTIHYTTLTKSTNGVCSMTTDGAWRILRMHGFSLWSNATGCKRKVPKELDRIIRDIVHVKNKQNSIPIPNNVNSVTKKSML